MKNEHLAVVPTQRQQTDGGVQAPTDHSNPPMAAKSRPINLMRLLWLVPAAVALCLPACQPIFANGQEKEGHEGHEHHQKIIATNPLVKDVTITQRYVCQIHSRNNTEISALEGGYLEEIKVKEGQAVKKGDELFRVIPTLYKAKLDAELAEARLAELEYMQTKKLHDEQVVSIQEVYLKEAKLEKARANAELARAEMDFATVKAPFDGIIDRQMFQQGSLVKEGDVLTTISDNGIMWVYFNVPEARYLDDMTFRPKNSMGTRIEVADTGIELQLANGGKFKYDAGTTVTVEGQCDLETGNFKYRADFPNPDGLLRNGQTGNVLIHRYLRDAIVIPQRATFEILDKRYVYVIDEEHVAHQRLLQIDREMEDVFVIKSGIGPNDKIVLDGVREVRDGDHIEFEYEDPAVVLEHLKTHAE